MSYYHSQALVLRRSDYREHDRILSLLMPERGRVEAIARGCRKSKSPLLSCSELFSLGEYVVYKGKGHEMVTACTLQETYYPLREDYQKLGYAAILLGAAELAAQPEQEQKHLLILTTRSLHRLAYSEEDPRKVVTAFLLHYASLQGVKPRLKHCAQCGRNMEAPEGAWLDPQAGGIVCRGCFLKESGAMRLEAPAIAWLQGVLTQGLEKTNIEPGKVPLPEMKRYVEQVLEHRLPRLPEYGAG